MQKRSELSKKKFALSILAMLIVLLFAGIITFQAYRLIFLGVGFLITSSIYLFIAMKQAWGGKGEVSLPWQKRYYVILALTFGSWAATLFISATIHNKGGNALTNSALVIFILLSVGFSIYSIVLSLQQLEKNKELK